MVGQLLCVTHRSPSEILRHGQRHKRIATAVQGENDHNVSTGLKPVDRSRVADDMTAYDSSKYTMTLPSSSASGEQRYMVGQPITVSWTAPANHSRKDWIGLYRLSAPQNVTRISSMGKWMPLYQGEYDGETPINNGDTIVKEDAGQIIFRGNQLPWTGGMYELRYHHDGKHNVMTRLAPIEIYGA